MLARGRPLLLRTVFQILCWISNKQISRRWNQFSDFAFGCKYEIWILKAKSRFPNRTHRKSDFGTTLAWQLIQKAHRVSSLSQDGQKFDRLCRTERFCPTKLKLPYQTDLDAALLARGRPLSGQTRLAPLSKRSTCSKSTLAYTRASSTEFCYPIPD